MDDGSFASTESKECSTACFLGAGTPCWTCWTCWTCCIGCIGCTYGACCMEGKDSPAMDIMGIMDITGTTGSADSIDSKGSTTSTSVDMLRGGVEKHG